MAGRDVNTTNISQVFLEENSTFAITHLLTGKIATLILQCFGLTFMGMTFIALSQTHHIPQVTKFLLQGLLIYDILANLSVLINIFISDETISYVLQRIGVGFILCSYCSVVMVALDRYMAINKPNVYLRTVTLKRCTYVSLPVWFLAMFFHQMTRNVLCFHGNIYTQSKACKMLYNLMLAITVGSIISICGVCYVSIYRTLRHQMKICPSNTMKLMKNYRSAYILPLYMANLLLFTVWTVILVYLVKQIEILHMLTCIMFTMIGILNTLIYVFWFNECKFKLVKMLAVCIPCLQKYVEPLRIEVFNICTREDYNTVNPI